MNKRWIAAVAVLALAGCSGGSGGGAELPDGQYDLGDGVSVAVLEVVDPLDVIRDRSPGMRDAVAEPGFRWIAVEIEYTNRTDKVVDTFGGELHTSDGVEAEGWLLQRSDMPELGNAIPSQASLRGWKAFQVAENADPTEFLFYGADADPVVVDL